MTDILLALIAVLLLWERVGSSDALYAMRKAAARLWRRFANRERH